MAATGYAWWIAHFHAMLTLVDIIHVDQFPRLLQLLGDAGRRADRHPWPLGAGPWPGPVGNGTATLGDVAIVAENGLLRARGQGQHGLHHAALRSAWHEGLAVRLPDRYQQQFLPHAYETPNLVDYPGTHDNDTTRRLVGDSSTPSEASMRCTTWASRRKRHHLGHDPPGLGLHRSAGHRHGAGPAQPGLLGEDEPAPARPGGNWQWRYLPPTGATCRLQQEPLALLYPPLAAYLIAVLNKIGFDSLIILRWLPALLSIIPIPLMPGIRKKIFAKTLL